MNDLNGKTILITGAARGIGAASALACHKAGAKIILHASAKSDAAAKAAEAIGQRADDFLYQDFTKDGAGAALVEKAVAKAGQIDAVLNNAGAYIATPLECDDAEWQDLWAKTMAINVQAPADICRAAIAHFQGRKSGGIIVNVASRAGHRGDGPDHSAYAASKGAVLAMTKTFARSLAGEGILFYAIAPGFVETRMAPEDIEKRAQAVKEIPLGRVATPEEVAATSVFLLSGAVPAATGSTFDINGASYVR